MRRIDSKTLASRPRHVLACALACVAALVVTACGGDGTPALSLQSASATATTGGQAVALHATLSGSNETPAWTLSGPGSLSAASGSTVDYLPPDGETVDQAASVTITVTAGGLSRQVQIALAATSLPGHAWVAGRPAATSWTRVAAASGVFVASGHSGALASSHDGISWQRSDTGGGTAWVSAAFGPAGWLAIGDHGEVATSSDGATWTMAPSIFSRSPTLGVLTPQVVAGNGVYVAVYADGSYVSADGLAWSAHASGFATIAFGNGVFVAADDGSDGRAQGLYASTDGVQWTLTQPDPQPLPIKDVAFGDGGFVATNLSSVTYTSSDGRTWVGSASVPNSVVGTLEFAGGSFYSAFAGNLFATTDGSDWSAPTLPAPLAVGLGAHFAATDSTLVAAFADGSIASGSDLQHLAQVAGPSYGSLLAVDHAGGRYVAAAPDRSLLLSSADGHAWTASALLAGVAPDSIAHAPDGTFVVAGSPEPVVPIEPPRPAPMFAYSKDGVTWTVADITVVPGGRTAWVLHDGRRFVCVDSLNHVYASPDGVAWSDLGSRVPQKSSAQGVQAVAFGNGRYVVVGLGGLASTSTDGVAWTTASPVMTSGAAPTALALSGVVFDGTRFVAVGAGGAVATSPDGQAWTVTASATTQALSGIAVSPGGLLVAVGGHGVAESSMDGVHWTLRASGASQGLAAVVFGDGAFAAVGDDSLIEVSTH